MSGQTVRNGTATRPVRVVVVGAGFGGVAMAIELRRAGFEDVTVLDGASELGGTWHYNDYPGAACDVASAFYSYSFAQRGDWTRFCSPRDEIRDYLQSVARDFGVTPHVVTSTTVRSCTWDDATGRWTIAASGPDGDVVHTADALVLATGQLNQPALPRVEGLDSFAGTAFHSARWDHDYDLTGKRVAVIGTGASAVQFVPEIVGSVAHLTIFQRTGNWFLPRQNKPYSARRLSLFGRIPGANAAFRFGIYLYTELLTVMIRHPRTLGLLGRLWSTLFMLGQLRGGGTIRRAVWPGYAFGCKRILFSSRWLPALQRDNVTLVTEPIAEMTPQGPRGADGTVHEVDCVIYGTGFRTTDFMFPMDVTGTGGRSLRDAWADGARAHLGITVPGFPSMFVMYGPNTNTSGGSILFFLEAQARYIRQAVQLLARSDAAVDLRPDVLDASDERTQQRFAGTAWTRCNSWYRDESGRIVTNWPGYMREYAAATRVLDPDDFELVRPPS